MSSAAGSQASGRVWSWKADWTEPIRRHPLIVVLGCAVTATAIGWRVGARPDLPAFLLLAIIGFPLAVIDTKLRRLPDPLTLPAYPVASGLLAAAALVERAGGTHFLHACIGLAALGGLFAAQWFIAPTSIGVGDVKLAGVLGLYLGWLGHVAWIAGVLCMYVAGALWAVILLVAGRAHRGSEIPFGPFMLVGALAGVLFTQ